MTQHPLQIAPSLLAADFTNLRGAVEQVEQGGAEILHLDIMDGHFVPNITFGPMIVEQLRPHSAMIFDVHLMIEKPERYIPHFAKAGADWISVHVETCPHLHRVLMQIREEGKKAGVVLNPVTPLESVFPALEYCDFVLLMSVNPGFGGQKFIRNVLPRAERLRHFLDTHGLEHVEIEVDGGVIAENAEEVARAGVNLLVSGSGVFKGNIAENIRAIRTAAERSRSIHV